MTQYLTASTAAQFPMEINDGFVRPQLGWSAYGPQHLEGVGGSCMTSNIWIGKPTAMRTFIEELATHYQALKDGFDEIDEDNGVSLGYWAKDDLAMIGEFCTGDMFFEMKTDALYEKMSGLHIVLCDGDDNDPGQILQNQVAGEELDVATRLLLAHFMTSSSKWVFIDDAADNGTKLEGFTQEDKALLRAILDNNS